MARKDDSFGLLDSLGLDGYDDPQGVRDSIRYNKINAGTKDALAGVDNPDRLDVSSARFGSAIANALAEKYGNGNYFGDDTERKLATVKATQSAYKAWAQGNPNASQEDHADAYQRFLAKNAMASGLYDVGIQAGRDLAQRQELRQKQRLELKKLGIETKVAEATADGDIAKGRREKFTTIYPHGSPYDPMDAYIDETGTAVLGNGSRLPLGSYATKPGQDESLKWYIAESRRNGAGGKALVTPTEAGKIRSQFVGAKNLFRNIDELRSLVTSDSDTNGRLTLGRGGEMASWVNKWVTTADEVLGSFMPDGKIGTYNVYNPQSGETFDLSTPGGRQAYINAHKGVLSQLLPKEFQNTAKADQIMSLMTSLTYAQARASEGGTSRTLSDTDFINNARIVGQNLNDPESLRATLIALARRTHTNLADTLSVYDPKILPQIVDPSAWDDYHKVLQGLEDSSSQPGSWNRGNSPADIAARKAAIASRYGDGAPVATGGSGPVRR